jgi:aspartate/methionine/tyrosine aminotransferase
MSAKGLCRSIDADAWWAQKLARMPQRLGRSGTVTARERAQLAHERGIDVIPLTGSPRFPLVPHVVDALIQAAQQHPTPPAVGMLELRVAIADKLGRDNQIVVDPDQQVLVTNGAKQALHVVLTSLLEVGDEVVFPSPSYVYSGTIELAGGVPHPVLMSEAEGYRWDPQRLEQALTPRTKVLLLNNPMNPTGFVADLDVLQAVADLADRHNLVVVMDEAHERLVYDGRRHVSLAALPEALDRTITVHSMSKGYNLMGYRVGYVAGPAPAIASATKILEWNSLSNNFLSQVAALAVLTGPQGWLRAMVKRCEDNRNLINTAINGTEGLSVVPPNGGAAHFVNVSNLGMDGDEFSDRLLMEYGVSTDPGTVFGEPNHVRLEAVGSAPDLVAKALDRIRDACANFVVHSTAVA